MITFRPVLVSCKSEPQKPKRDMLDDERELQAMKWGLVPSWHRGDPASFGYKMNNARIESITEKKSFKGALEKGRRCVVLAEGLVSEQFYFRDVIYNHILVPLHISCLTHSSIQK